VVIATAATAIMTAVFAIIDNISIALAASILFGMGWVAALTSLSSSAQVALLDWVRARGLSVYLMLDDSGQRRLGSGRRPLFDQSLVASVRCRYAARGPACMAG
jgi:hypothetical protein